MGNNLLPDTQCLGHRPSNADISKEIIKRSTDRKRTRVPSPSSATSCSNEDNLPLTARSHIMTKSLEYHNQKQSDIHQENSSLKHEISELKKQLQEMKYIQSFTFSPQSSYAESELVYCQPSYAESAFVSVPIGALSAFLEYDELLAVFLQFMRENNLKQHIKLVEFYVYCDELKHFSQKPNATKYEFEQKTQFIMNRFFDHSSDHYLFQLSKATLQNVMIVINAYDTIDSYGKFDYPDLFAGAMKEVCELLSVDVFVLFTRSEKYKQLVIEGKIIQPSPIF